MGKRKLSVLSIVLYVLAGIFAIYTVWAAVNISDSISQQMAQNQMPFKGNEFSIINYFMSSIGYYWIFAIVLAVLGWILQKMAPVAEPAPAFGDQMAFAADETTVDDSVDEASVEDAVNQFEASAEPKE